MTRHVLLLGSGIPLGVSLLIHVGITAIAADIGTKGIPMAGTPPLIVEISVPEVSEALTPELTTSVAVVKALQTPPSTLPRRIQAPDPGPMSIVRDSAKSATEVSRPVENSSPRFVIAVAPTFVVQEGSTSAQGVTTGALIPPAPLPESVVETPAKLKSGNAPAYTRAALAAGVEADVPLEIVVNENGAVVSARAAVHIGYGLDEVAIQSVNGYRFTPALRGHKAVAVRMRWVMRFQLR